MSSSSQVVRKALNKVGELNLQYPPASKINNSPQEITDG